MILAMNMLKRKLKDLLIKLPSHTPGFPSRILLYPRVMLSISTKGLAPTGSPESPPVQHQGEVSMILVYHLLLN